LPNGSEQRIPLEKTARRPHLHGMSLLRKSNTLAKTITFAAVHFTVAFSIGYLLTGSAAIAGALALIEPAANTFAYYLHERLWERSGRAFKAQAAAG
jgi:uncharacterized membrane protein